MSTSSEKLSENLSWAETVRLVRQRANGCYEYCQTCEDICAQALHTEHIIPGVGNHPDNLCLSRANCNLSKADATAAFDPVTNEPVPLFNPRQQHWADHFEWINHGTQIVGLTSVGRATVKRLKMNLDRAVTARRIWVVANAHPPVINVPSSHPETE